MTATGPSTSSSATGTPTKQWTNPTVVDPHSFLGSGPEIETQHPLIRELAIDLRRGRDDEEFARATFEWVRDQIAHSFDVQDPRVTLTASQVLREGVGLCYAKSHLAAALLRGGGVPTGLCYQLLRGPGDRLVLHGLIAVHLRGRWHRQDPRGNTARIDAQFCLDAERLAFTLDRDAGELDHPDVWVGPAPSVVRALSQATNILTATLPTSATPSAHPSG